MVGQLFYKKRTGASQHGEAPYHTLFATAQLSQRPHGRYTIPGTGIFLAGVPGEQPPLPPIRSSDPLASMGTTPLRRKAGGPRCHRTTPLGVLCLPVE